MKFRALNYAVKYLVFEISGKVYIDSGIKLT